MASLYTRPNSVYLWIKYKGTDGAWKRKSTGYRKDNPGDQQQARKLCRIKSMEEMRDAPVQRGGWEWGAGWIESRWGQKQGQTLLLYKRYFLRWLKYFGEHGITQPGALRREHVTDYIPWRAKHGGGRNSAIYEIKFLAMLMDEAISRGFATENPARKLGLKKETPAEKRPWSEHEIATVQAAFESPERRFGWMHVTFLMGLFQAARIRQAQVPLACIDLRRRIIDYPGEIVKGGKRYTQPINPEFYPTLVELVAHRQKLNEARLCEVPALSGVEWRDFLDSLGITGVSHHSLRVTFITRAALAGVPEAMTRRFVNHSSQQIHQIYQRITATDLLPMFDALMLARFKASGNALPEVQQS